jgi:hypothetical protein
MVDTDYIDKQLRKYFIIQGPHTIDQITGVVDVDGDVSVGSGITSLPELPVQFGTVNAFKCRDVGLTSLKGSPHTVGTLFWASGNKLQSLNHGPHTVGTGYWVHNNQLRSLQGAPRSVPQRMWCSGNQLRDLQGAPQSVGSLWIGKNPLRSLLGMPKTISTDILLTYDPELPLLKTLIAPNILFNTAPPAPPEVSKALNSHAGRDQAHILACAIDLIKYGYAANAKQ